MLTCVGRVEASFHSRLFALQSVFVQLGQMCLYRSTPWSVLLGVSGSHGLLEDEGLAQDLAVDFSQGHREHKSLLIRETCVNVHFLFLFLWNNREIKTALIRPDVSLNSLDPGAGWSRRRLLYLPLSSSCFFTPTVLGLPRPLRMGSDWLLARDLLLFSMSFVKEESMRSLRMRSVLLRFRSSLSAESIPMRDSTRSASTTA